MKITNTKKQSTTRHDPENQTFGLVGHFALTAVFSVTLAAFALGYLYQQSARINLVENAESNHAETARLYTKLIWPRFGRFLLNVDENTIVQLTSDAEFKRLHEEIATEITASKLLKVKIFNSEGLTIYSSDPSQLGALKKGYSGFGAAITGTIFTELSFRGTFNMGDHWQALKNRHVASSYLPIYEDYDSTKPIAVFELYSDVTPLVISIVDSRNKMLSITISIMLLLLVVLLLNIKQADAIIKRQVKTQTALREKADWHANHDILTGLPNRRYFNNLLENTLSSAALSLPRLAVLFIDIDEFKPINDRYGHHVGDQILVELANKIQMALPEGSVVARLGGDEFVAMVDCSSGEPAIQHHMNAIFLGISSSINVNESSFTLGASIGVTWCLESDQAIDDIIARADKAMYDAKKSGKNRVSFYGDTEFTSGFKLAG